jgi:N-acetylglucosamine-6-phosphate deacetylase
MEDGIYYLSGMQVNVKDGKAINNDGAIAGSTTNIFDGLKNLCKATGAPFEDLVLTATANPAKQVGIYDKTGSIEVGKRADMILTDKENVLLTVAAGKIIQN